MVRQSLSTYVPNEPDLRRAYTAIQRAAELLELVEMPFEYQIAREIRERIRERLIALHAAEDTALEGPRGVVLPPPEASAGDGRRATVSGLLAGR